MESLDVRKYVVKIQLYQGHIVDKVLYYKRQLNYNQIKRFEWYFNLLRSIANLAFPKSKVELKILDDTLPLKDDYIREKTINLIKGKKRRLTQLNSEYKTAWKDMFGEVDKHYRSEIDKTEKELNDLQNGKVIFWVMPEYINMIKKIINDLKQIENDKETKN